MEAAIVIPLVVVVAALLLQVATVAVDRVHLVSVTATAARSAMVEPRTAVARRAAEASAGDLQLRSVSLRGPRNPGSLMVVEVSARPRRLPLVGLAVARLQLHESITVRVEGDG